MRDMTFFEGIQQISHAEGGHEFLHPCVYYDTTTINAVFLAPLRAIRQRLPSKQLKPIRVTPLHGLVAITAFEYRDTDIGPYNELSISVPVTVGKAAPIGLGALGVLREPNTFVTHLPVTTEIARYGGVEFYGFPKFVAEIEFTREDGWLRCRLAADGQHILTFSAQQLATRQGRRYRMHAYTLLDGRILRCEIVVNPGQQGASRRADEVRLELGDHPMASEVAAMRPGRLVQLQYMPQSQSALTAVLESWPGS